MEEKKQRPKRKKIIFVCAGNTCRSPMAQAIMRSKIKERKIKYVDAASAGIYTEKDAVINEKSEKVLSDHGLYLKNFKPKQINVRAVQASYVTICMNDKLKDVIIDYGNVYSMNEIIGEGIPDPYGYGIDAYEYVYEKLSYAIDIILDRLFLPEKN